MKYINVYFLNVHLMLEPRTILGADLLESRNSRHFRSRTINNVLRCFGKSFWFTQLNTCSLQDISEYSFPSNIIILFFCSLSLLYYYRQIIFNHHRHYYYNFVVCINLNIINKSVNKIYSVNLWTMHNKKRVWIPVIVGPGTPPPTDTLLSNRL